MSRTGYFIIAAAVSLIAAAGWAQSEPSPEMLRQSVRDYVAGVVSRQGAFGLLDERSNALRRLELVRVHDSIGKTGNYYYACSDMNDVNTGDVLDIDFDIEDRNGVLYIADIRIHKDNGNPRYTYDENEVMIPVPQ